MVEIEELSVWELAMVDEAVKRVEAGQAGEKLSSDEFLARTRLLHEVSPLIERGQCLARLFGDVPIVPLQRHIAVSVAGGEPYIVTLKHSLTQGEHAALAAAFKADFDEYIGYVRPLAVEWARAKYTPAELESISYDDFIDDFTDDNNDKVDTKFGSMSRAHWLGKYEGVTPEGYSRMAYGDEVENDFYDTAVSAAFKEVTGRDPD